jgi:excisionase family DNA binding protein
MAYCGEIDFSPADLPEQIERQRDALTIPWLAGKLSCSPQLLYRMAEKGKLPSFRIGSLIRLSPAATAAWLRTRQCGTIQKTTLAAKGKSGSAASQSFEMQVPRTNTSLRQKANQKQQAARRTNLSAGGGYCD